MDKKQQILLQLEQIFRTELNDNCLEITFDSSANDVEQWDSINNLVLISAIEEKFNISFPIEVIFSANNVGDLINYIVDNTSN
jgi:acyl carrier protein